MMSANPVYAYWEKSDTYQLKEQLSNAFLKIGVAPNWWDQAPTYLWGTWPSWLSDLPTVTQEIYGKAKNWSNFQIT